MPAALVLAPVDPERVAEWRAFYEELRGPRRGEWAQSQRRRGVQREAIWLLQGDAGITACYLIEALEPRAARHALRTSADPFDCWFRDRWDEVHSGPEFVTEAVFDTRPPSGAWRGLRARLRRWRG